MDMKKEDKKELIKASATLIIIIILFILISYVVNSYLDELKAYTSSHYFLGVLVYVFISAISIIFAPVSSLPLIPFASKVWGWQLSAAYSAAGWTIGNIVSFFVARRYGKPLVEKVISLKRIEKFEKYIPENNIFFSIVLLTIVLPLDGLSYALGLFSNVKLKVYILATIIGIIPFAVIFAILGTLPLVYQLIGLAVSLILVGVLLYIGYKMNKKIKKRN